MSLVWDERMGFRWIHIVIYVHAALDPRNLELIDLKTFV